MRLRCLSKKNFISASVCIEYYISCRSMYSSIQLISRRMFSYSFRDPSTSEPNLASAAVPSIHDHQMVGAFWTESSLPKIRLQDESSSHSTWTTNHHFGMNTWWFFSLSLSILITAPVEASKGQKPPRPRIHWDGNNSTSDGFMKGCLWSKLFTSLLERKSTP